MFFRKVAAPETKPVEKVTKTATLYATDDLLQRAKNIVALLPMGMPQDFASTCVLKVPMKSWRFTLV